jgi:SAM-dependent methyltransferase
MLGVFAPKRGVEDRGRAARRRTHCTTDPAPARVRHRSRTLRPGSPERGLFIVLIALSAFLLFTLELLAGRLVLPVFGGTPGVWATTLCFFTAVLFVGYLYAHIVATRLDPRRGATLHLVVATVAVGATFFAPSDIGSLRLPGVPEALVVLRVLALIAGPAAFLLATTTPLLSAWYFERGHDPWWLYAMSNAASLAALLAYPLVLEPTIGLAAQRFLLSVGLALLALGLLMISAPGHGMSSATRTGAAARTTPTAGAGLPPALTTHRQATWLLAAFVPAGLLPATTNFLTTDLVSAPLLWVGPLAIYLLSFVITFSARGRRMLGAFERFVPVAAMLLWAPSINPSGWPLLALLPVELGAFGVLAVAIHGRLALDRPDERDLTRFYLVISAGGVLATAFVALLAPLAFNSIVEFPLLIVAGLTLLAAFPWPVERPTQYDPPSVSRVGFKALAAMLNVRERGHRDVFRRLALATGRDLWPYLAVGAVLSLLIARRGQDGDWKPVAFLATGAVVIAIGRSRGALAAGTAIATVVLSIVASPQPLVQARTFFGVIKVLTDGVANAEYSGTTLHGGQFLDQDRRHEPTTYYVRRGPLGSIFEDLRARRPDGSDIGVVGLGAGTAMAYASAGDRLTFFEIDQAVVDIARNPLYFTYLADSPVQPRIVIGDARLSIAEEPPAAFDLLILDAFASDSVPVHLLTREAIAAYARVLRPGGILAFQLSNRHYRLLPAVSSTAEAQGLAALGSVYAPEKKEIKRIGARPARWLVAGARNDVLRFEAKGWRRVVVGPVLTDDFSDLLPTVNLGSL